ncbi:MAG TPA: DUF502 domain-containing protein [Phycisphaerales bacterium]|nr:DUF502 domain-containing protein [Phycisphaerales bacterium]
MQAFKNFRIYFLRGMAALLPTILTIWIFVQCYIFVQEKISVHINRGVVRLVVAVVDWYPPITNEQKRAYAIRQEPALQNDPRALARRLDDPDIIRGTRIEVAEKYWVTGRGQIAGIIIAIIGVVFIGAFLYSVMGRTMYRLFENALMQLPLVRKVYPYIKQITDFILANRQISFTKVIALQYPRKGTWSIGLVTGSGLAKIGQAVDKEFLTVFVPTSPTPFTGYVIITPKEDTIELDMTIEEALRFTISGGVISPAQREAFRTLANKASE